MFSSQVHSQVLPLHTRSSMSLWTLLTTKNLLMCRNTGTKGPNPFLKQPHTIIPRPSTNLYTWHNALRLVPFSWQPPNPDSSISLPDEAWWVTPENTSSLLFALHHWHTRLRCSCSAMENSFHEALYTLFLS